MARLPGWRKRMVDTIERFRREPFRYGQADCAVMAAAVVEAITGKKPGPAKWRTYRSEKAALKTMRGAGFDNLGDLAGSLLPEIHPSEATMGDIAAIPVDGAFGFALGIVSGDRIFVFGQDYDGLGHVDLLSAKRAFRVG